MRQCLDGFVMQKTTFPFEAIVHDDASTDGSLAVLREYSRRDPRFEVIPLAENQGQAHARNVALQQAKGEYTCFLDADDWYAPDTLELMTKAFDDKTDCVLMDVVMLYSDHETLYPLHYVLPVRTLFERVSCAHSREHEKKRHEKRAENALKIKMAG